MRTCFSSLLILPTLAFAAGCSGNDGPNPGEITSVEMGWSLIEPRTENGGPGGVPPRIAASADTCSSYNVGDIVLSWTIDGDTEERTVACADPAITIEVPEGSPMTYGARYPDEDTPSSTGTISGVRSTIPIEVPVRIRPGRLMVSWSGVDCMGTTGLPAIIDVVEAGTTTRAASIDTNCGEMGAEIELQPGRYDVQLDLNRGGTPSYSARESDLDVDWGVDVDVSLMP